MSSIAWSDSRLTNHGLRCQQKTNRENSGPTSTFKSLHLAHASFLDMRLSRTVHTQGDTDEIPNNSFIFRCDLAVWRFGDCRRFTRQETGEDSQDGSHDPERSL